MTNDSVASCHSCIASVRDSVAATTMQDSSTMAQTSRISFWGTRSATTPPSSAGTTSPTAPAVETTDSSAGPPPMRMTSQTRPISQTPPANVCSTSATASRR